MTVHPLPPADAGAPPRPVPQPPATAFDFSARDIDGHEQSLQRWRGQVLLLVNTASACGFTPQYAGLQALFHAYRGRGFSVLAFPCNQFGAQEPGTAAQIAAFCETNYGVEFPIFDKIDVNGARAHPLWRWLKEQASGVLGTEAIKWNFTKFLVGRDGQVIRRYSPQTQPDALRADIEMALGAPAA